MNCAYYWIFDCESLQYYRSSNHEGHKEHKDFSFLRALCVLRGSKIWRLQDVLYSLRILGFCDYKIRTLILKFV
jgi:hypothetical protein